VRNSSWQIGIVIAEHLDRSTCGLAPTHADKKEATRDGASGARSPVSVEE
jgi:hypothetical protein